MKHSMLFSYCAAGLLFLGACHSENQSDPSPMLVFEPLETGVSFTCRALSVPDDQTIWASGSHNTVLRSIDGGAHWTACQMPADYGELDYRSLHAWNADSAVVFSTTTPAVGLKTTDGGSTWSTVFSTTDPAVFVNSLSFKNATQGIVMGDAIDGYFFLLSSADGGNSWQAATAPSALPGQGAFAASNTCIQYLPSGKIVFGTGVTGSSVFLTNDADWQWQSAESQIAKSEQSSDGIYTVYMLDDATGLVGGGNYREVERNEQVLSYTHDGGVTWTLAEKQPHGFVSGLAAFPENPLWIIAVGSDGCSLSLDQGESWEDQTAQLPTDVKGYHVAKASQTGQALFVAGDKGQLAKVTLQK